MDYSSVFVYLNYLLPGFITLSMVSIPLRIKEKETSRHVFLYLFFSLINIYFIEFSKFVLERIGIKILIENQLLVSFLKSIVMPIVVAIIIIEYIIFIKRIKQYKIDAERTNESLIERWHLDFISRSNSAWDFVASHFEENGAQVTIVLVGGEEVYGLISKKSYVSYLALNDANSILIENTYKNKKFKKLTGVAVVLHADKILQIKFNKELLQIKKGMII